MSDESQMEGKSEAARPSETPQEFLRLTWEEILKHFALKEFIRLEGHDMAREPFWVILQSSDTHWVHVLAYGYRGEVGRAPAGESGIISIRPGEWGSIRTEIRPDGTARLQCGSSVMEPATRDGAELRIAIGNLVDYVRGHSLDFKATARDLNYRFIKQWDLPMEFALSAGVTGQAAHADVAAKSVVSERSAVSGEAIRVNLVDSPAPATWPEEPVQQLPAGKVHLLWKGGERVLNVIVDTPVLLRVFVPEQTAQSEAEVLNMLSRTAQTESLVHMRLRSMQKSKGDPHEGLHVLYFDADTNKTRCESLSDRNLVALSRLPDGNSIETVKLRERPAADPPGSHPMVRIENIAADSNVIVAVWTSDPILPKLKQGAKVGKGRFTLSRALGAGGMGVVWMAFDEQLNEFVALKFLPPQVRNDPHALQDLRVETLKSRQLSHPHIIRIHDLHMFEGEPPFISMEYVDGLTLHELRLRQRHGILSWAHIEIWITQLCEALEYAHREKVVHLDLKPSNLMIDDKARLKLADFGLATAVTEAGVPKKTAPIKGTLGYMSPQQLQGRPGQIADDIYGLGATLYTLLTSQPPFHKEEGIEQVLSRPAKPMAEKLAELGLQSEIPAPVSGMVMTCLDRDPARRPRSALAVIRAISKSMSNYSPPPIVPEASGNPGRWLRNLLKGNSNRQG